MKRHPRLALVALLFLLLLFTAGVAVLAQTSSDFNLEWRVIGAGGGPSASADFMVNGSIGQSLASPPRAAGSHFVVSSGYWQSGTMVYLPLVLRN